MAPKIFHTFNCWIRETTEENQESIKSFGRKIIKKKLENNGSRCHQTEMT